MRFFIAGIMQGSYLEMTLHSQNYRNRIREELEKHIPHAEIYDPYDKHPNSSQYAPKTGKDIFLYHNRLCREMDVLIAFAPEATMGTAIEMWEAWQHGAFIACVSPMRKNWTVAFLSHVIYETLDELLQDIRSGVFLKMIEKHREEKTVL